MFKRFVIGATVAGSMLFGLLFGTHAIMTATSLTTGQSHSACAGFNTPPCGAPPLG